MAKKAAKKAASKRSAGVKTRVVSGTGNTSGRHVAAAAAPAAAQGGTLSQRREAAMSQAITEGQAAGLGPDEIRKNMLDAAARIQ